MTAYDAIVIGTGQAGPYVTSRLAGAGMKVAVIERNAFGGTCVNTGCIPTKTMVASAYAARMAARAAYALATIVLVGMQPVLTHVPPKALRSMTATFIPAPARREVT